MKKIEYGFNPGQRFGRLTAMYPTKKRDAKGFVIWHCRCDCGNEPDVSYNNLMYCGQQSCGCRKKEHDQELGTLLTHVGGTSLEMIQSQKLPRDNTTGYKGVYLVRGKYMAKIVFQKYLYRAGTDKRFPRRFGRRDEQGLRTYALHLQLGHDGARHRLL